MAEAGQAGEKLETAETTGVVFNVMRYCLHDGPGIRTTVFFKGCPLECWWCHNPEGQRLRPEPVWFEERCRHCGTCILNCPEQAISNGHGGPATDAALCLRCGTCVEACAAAAREICGRRVTVDELITELERDVIFFDDSGGGVTLSGGEPMAQPIFARALLRACREHGIHTAIETCGYAPADVFMEIAHAADLVLFDLKILDRDKHRHYTGVWNDRILGNLEALAATGWPMVARIPVIPGINDSDDDAQGFASYLSQVGVGSVELLPYHRIGSQKYRRLGLPARLDGAGEPCQEHMERFADPLRRMGIRVKIGG
jgi:pyruvate formate lyase activating enzyme